MSTKEKQKQEIQTITILPDFLLMLLFKKLEDFLFLLLTILIMAIKKLKETVTQNIFFPRVNITNYNILTDGRNFYDQSINDQFIKYDKIRQTVTGQGDDYTAGCLLDYHYFKDHWQLIAVDLSNRKNWILIEEQFNKLSFMEC